MFRGLIASSATCWRTPCVTHPKEPRSRLVCRIRTVSCWPAWTMKVRACRQTSVPTNFSRFSRKAEATPAKPDWDFISARSRWSAGAARSVRRLAPGGGSRFWFRLPRAAQNRGMPLRRSAGKNGAEKTMQRKKKAEKPLRILVADDAEINRELIIELLRKRGHIAEGVANGRQVLAALEQSQLRCGGARRRNAGNDRIASHRCDSAARRPLPENIRSSLASPATPPKTTNTSFREAGMDASFAKPVEVNNAL